MSQQDPKTTPTTARRLWPTYRQQLLTVYTEEHLNSLTEADAVALYECARLTPLRLCIFGYANLPKLSHESYANLVNLIHLRKRLPYPQELCEKIRGYFDSAIQHYKDTGYVMQRCDFVVPSSFEKQNLLAAFRELNVTFKYAAHFVSDEEIVFDELTQLCAATHKLLADIAAGNIPNSPTILHRPMSIAGYTPHELLPDYYELQATFARENNIHVLDCTSKSTVASAEHLATQHDAFLLWRADMLSSYNLAKLICTLTSSCAKTLTIYLCYVEDYINETTMQLMKFRSQSTIRLRVGRLPYFYDNSALMYSLKDALQWAGQYDIRKFDPKMIVRGFAFEQAQICVVPQQHLRQALSYTERRRKHHPDEVFVVANSNYDKRVLENTLNTKLPQSELQVLLMPQLLRTVNTLCWYAGASGELEFNKLSRLCFHTNAALLIIADDDQLLYRTQYKAMLMQSCKV